MGTPSLIAPKQFYALCDLALSASVDSPASLAGEVGAAVGAGVVSRRNSRIPLPTAPKTSGKRPTPYHMATMIRMMTNSIGPGKKPIVSPQLVWR